MQLTPAQKIIAKDDHRFRVVCAGRRFGKTHLIAEEIIGVAIKQDGLVVPYIGPTFQQARDIAWAHFKKRYKPITVSANDSRLEITVRTQDGGQSLIVLKSWEAIESLRGQKFPFVAPDEVGMYRGFWTGWNEVLRPALADYKGGALFTSTPKGFNHFYDLYNTDHDDWKSFHFTSYDNPNIDREEINDAKAQLPEDVFAQEYMADFRKQSGLVYKEFRREVHVTDELPTKTVHRYGGLDFGFNNPTALLDISVDHDNVYWVTAEWYKTGQTHEQIAELASMKKYNAIYPDPEEAAGIETLKRNGVNVREVIKGKGSVKGGIDKVKELFKQQRIKIHSSCKNLIMELEMYAYPEEKTGTDKDDVPIKEHDHALDALRYVIMMTSNKPETLQRRVFPNKKALNPAL